MLDNLELREINGGNQQSYDEGRKVGEAIRKTLIFIGLTSWIFL